MIIQTGSKNIIADVFTKNVWSDEARAAALEARKAAMSAADHATGYADEKTRQSKSKTNINKVETHTDAAKAHTEAAALHQKVVDSLPEGAEGRGASRAAVNYHTGLAKAHSDHLFNEEMADLKRKGQIGTSPRPYASGRQAKYERDKDK